jgi:hypothetical protein
MSTPWLDSQHNAHGTERRQKQRAVCSGGCSGGDDAACVGGESSGYTSHEVDGRIIIMLMAGDMEHGMGGDPHDTGAKRQKK